MNTGNKKLTLRLKYYLTGLLNDPRANATGQTVFDFKQ